MSRNYDNFKRGTIELLSLMLINENEDLHPYKIASILKSRSEGSYTLLESSLYLALMKMEEKGFLTSHEITVKKKLKHRCYNITEAGKERLATLINDYDNVTKAISMIRNWEDDSEQGS